MQQQLTPQAPAPSGLDSTRVIFERPDGGTHEAPVITPAPHFIRSVIRKFEEIGFRFIRAERKPEGFASDWPWEEIAVEWDGGDS